VSNCVADIVRLGGLCIRSQIVSDGRGRKFGEEVDRGYADDILCVFVLFVLTDPAYVTSRAEYAFIDRFTFVL
jgi:hypothetical protein